MTTNKISLETFDVDGNQYRRLFVHEAGHAVAAVKLSFFNVEIPSGKGVTNEGIVAERFCEYQYALIENEPIENLYERRITVAYAGVMAEALFLKNPMPVLDKAIRLLDQTGLSDKEHVGALVSNCMPVHIKSREATASIRLNAWHRAYDVVRTHRDPILAVAKELEHYEELSDPQIRALVSPAKTAEL